MSIFLSKKKDNLIYGVSRRKNSFFKKYNLEKKIKIKLLKNYHDEKNLNEILKINFDEIYFCGGQSNVKKSLLKKKMKLI